MIEHAKERTQQIIQAWELVRAGTPRYLMLLES